MNIIFVILIWASCGLAGLVYREFFWISKKYRIRNLKNEYKSGELFKLIGISILFGPIVILWAIASGL